MRRIVFLVLTLSVGLTAPSMAGQTGLVSVKSAHSVGDTTDRLIDILDEKGMTVFLRLDHAEGAAGVDITLRPTGLIIFGNPKVGGPLMEKQQTIGIDLPQKMLIWQDASGQVWLTYNEADYLAERHGLANDLPQFEKVRKALAAFAQAAGAP
jgi:YD repeat-containing protein